MKQNNEAEQTAAGKAAYMHNDMIMQYRTVMLGQKLCLTNKVRTAPSHARSVLHKRLIVLEASRSEEETADRLCLNLCL